MKNLPPMREAMPMMAHTEPQSITTTSAKLNEL